MRCALHVHAVIAWFARRVAVAATTVSTTLLLVFGTLTAVVSVTMLQRYTFSQKKQQ